MLMGPPHPRNSSVCFLADDAVELISIMGDLVSLDEQRLISEYVEAGLPPVTSINAISAMFGYNPGFVWSLVNRSHKYYRTFHLPKGKGQRQIRAPKVALKAIQRWLGTHFVRKWEPLPHVFGFVPGKSHIDAAAEHLGAHWVVSVDIENFFPSVSSPLVVSSLRALGYHDEFSLASIKQLTCYGFGLAQGSPTSPVLSNIALQGLDHRLLKYARHHGYNISRYADDIVISGKESQPQDVLEDISSLILEEGWRISEDKSRIDVVPGRLKVHGLLVHGDYVRLTKGYRNRIRAYRHLWEHGRLKEKDIPSIRGHLEFSRSVEEYSKEED